MTVSSIVRKLVRSTGYDICRIVDVAPSITYRDAVLGCLRRLGKVSIVVVGANDGKYNDPLYPIMMENKSMQIRSKVLLIEPQLILNKYIHDHYSFHPDYRVDNCVIDAGTDVTLYSVKEEFWSRAQPDYAAGWPIYRAPTGGTSMNRSHVLLWVKANIPDLADPGLAIVETTVRAKTLDEALRSNGMGPEVDILQIDAEGNDDSVIYASDIAQSRPHVIFYETMNLGEARRAKLARFLVTAGYAEVPSGGDSIAIRIG